MQVDIFTLFPELFPGPLGVSVVGRAMAQKIWSLNVVNIRDFAQDKHRQVDGTPYGGGPGMVMRADVIDQALSSVYGEPQAHFPLYYLSPRGSVLTQKKAQDLAQCKRIGFLCGRFEGVDERLLQHWQMKEISIGDYVLTNGDVAVHVLLDAVLRLMPQVVGDKDSLADESITSGLLEYPHYTRPRSFKGHNVPDVLLSGNHREIDRWRYEQAYEITKMRRPDLLR